MRKSIALATGIGVLLVVTTIALIVISALSAFEASCEVCLTFRGRSQCREAFGKTQDEAVRTAQDNACAFLASGMTASIACQNTTPDRVTCEPQGPAQE